MGIQNQISAAETSIGFDYQFYYFFFLLLDLRHGEKIGFEVKDDIHVELPTGETLLIQTKHSVQTNSAGQIINLTERDGDLWKTIGNWVKIIQEQTDAGAFLQMTSFKLLTNKNNNQNPFFTKIQDAAEGIITIKDFKGYLQNLINTTSDESIKSSIALLHSLKNPFLLAFIKKINFDLNEDNLIDRIKVRLLEKIHISERIDDVYNSLHSTLRDKNYLDVKKGKAIEISFLEFNQNFRHCFKVGLSSKLPIREFKIVLPSNPLNQLFIKQLLDIRLLESFEQDDIIELTTHMLMIRNNLSEWESNGDIGPSTRKQFDDNSILIWKNSFNSKYREIKRRHNNGENINEMEGDIQKAAIECLDEMQKAILTIEETQLDTKLSNGHFYLLTEERSIGWHFDWRNKYQL